jgi:hypothetical protein
MMALRIIWGSGNRFVSEPFRLREATIPSASLGKRQQIMNGRKISTHGGRRKCLQRDHFPIPPFPAPAKGDQGD